MMRRITSFLFVLLGAPVGALRTSIKLGPHGEILECTDGPDGREKCVDPNAPKVGGNERLIKMLEDNEEYHRKEELKRRNGAYKPYKRPETPEEEAERKEKEAEAESKDTDAKKSGDTGSKMDLGALLNSPQAAKEMRKALKDGKDLDLSALITNTIQKEFSKWGQPQQEVEDEDEEGETDEETTVELLMNAALRTIAKQHGGDDPFLLVENNAEQREFLGRLAKVLANFNGADRDIDAFLHDLMALASPHAEEGAVVQEIFNATQSFRDTLEALLGDMALELFHPLQVYYYMIDQEQKKNPVWKRNKHRYLQVVPEAEVLQMTDGLYLSQLAYLDSCNAIRDHIELFQIDSETGKGSWLLRNCTTESGPYQPAHFLLTPRQLSTQTSALEFALVIRGSQQASDLISVGTISAVPYRDGYAHEGIVKSAKWIVDTYVEDMKQLLEKHRKNQRKRKLPLKLYTMGHSLGGGTSAVAAMEFNDFDSFEAFSVGFGTPASLSPALSMSVKDRISTVVTDADCVPRLSENSIVEAWRELIQFNFTELVLDDIAGLAAAVKSKASIFGDWTDSVLEKMRLKVEERIRTEIKRQLKKAQKALANTPASAREVLVPPGDCVHFYRDGTSWQSVYLPCDAFREVELVPNMIEDHFVKDGYYQAMLAYLRMLNKDMNFKPPHAVDSIHFRDV